MARSKASRPPAHSDDALNLTCGFCNKTLASERALFVHLCEKKRRFMQRGEKPVKLALTLYRYFLRQHLRRSERALPDIGGFERSSYYRVFVRIARWMMQWEVYNCFGYVDWLLAHNQRVDTWDTLALYELYLREVAKTEAPEDAVARNIMLMEQWGASQGEEWTDFFRRVSPQQAVLWITNGRLSPWALLAAASAAQLFERLSPEQLAIVEQHIDYAFWRKKLDNHADDVVNIKATFAEYNL